MTEPNLRIALAEDDPAHAEAIRRAFRASRASAELDVAGTLREYRAVTRARVPDIALLDLNLPDGRAVEVLTSPPEMGRFPVLIMTSFGDEQVAVEAMKSGALDYIVKSAEAFSTMPRIVDRALREWSLLQARRQALEAQRRSAERWQATFDAISDVVCVVSSDGRLVEINQAGCRSLGTSRDRIIGRTWEEIARDRGSPLAVCACRSVGRGGNPVAVRDQERGEIYDIVVWPIVDGAGPPSGSVHIIKDVTAEVDANREKERLQEQLELAQRLEAIGRVAGGVAHDFNNLLSVIVGNADFVVQGLRGSDPVRADVVEIQAAAERAAALTRQLLAFSRSQILEPKVLDLNRVVVGIESMLRRLLGEDIDIEVHLDRALGNTRADPGQIEQVIMNLAVNARDAMPQGGKMTIETANVDLDQDYAGRHIAVRPGSYVMLSVADTGSGMDPETLEHVFEPFYTTKERGKGTGLGLSTVYGIVKQSGGNVWVYSEPGSGAVFKVYLPRVYAPASALEEPPTAALATGSETVLLVEDEDAVRRVAERILRGAGYEVLSAAGGPEAMALCERRGGAVDLLLTDVVMPQMSGRELAERLARTNPRLKVVYMSGYTDNAIVHHGVLDPGMRFVGKPFAASELTRKVREALDGS